MLNKQLVNKENQFREMSTQLVGHLKTINDLTAEINEIKSGNAVLKGLIGEKDDYLARLLKEKLELFEVLQALENPEESKENIEAVQNEENPPEKIDENFKAEIEKNFDIAEEEEEKIVKEESKEEAYISDEIDITSELEKLGLVDLVKKY